MQRRASGRWAHVDISRYGDAIPAFLLPSLTARGRFGMPDNAQQPGRAALFGQKEKKARASITPSAASCGALYAAGFRHACNEKLQ